MSEQFGAEVSNTVHNQGHILSLLQIGHMHGHVSIHMGDLRQTETEEVLAEYQSYLVATFQPADPPAYESFREVFREKRWGLLLGEPGSGRESAAIALHDFCGLRVHSPVLDEKPHLRLDRLFPVAGGGYLIDLSGVSSPGENLVRAVLSLKERVVSQKAALLVIASSERFATELPQAPLLWIERPSGIDVLSRHLERLMGEGLGTTVTRHEAVRERMSKAAPADAARLARIAYRTYLPLQQQEIDVANWINQVLDAYGDWRKELDDWFGNHRGEGDAWHRIVLISTAFLEGHEASTVLTAADALARKLNIPPGDAGGLLGIGTDPTFEVVGAERVAGESVRFTRPEYADAVLEYVWAQFPRIREALIGWSGELVTGAPGNFLATVCRSWVRLALLRGDSALTMTLFDRWAGHTETERAAVEFSVAVASSPVLGRALRKRIREIARKSAGDHRSQTVAEVCVGYGRTDPVSALVRLKWLAEADEERVRRIVPIALDRMVTHEPNEELWAEVVHVIVNEWCHEGVSARRRWIALRFLVRTLGRLEAGVPERTENPGSGASHLIGSAVGHAVHMWRAVFDLCAADLEEERVGQRAKDREAVVNTLGAWIRVALSDDSRADAVVNTLVGAAAPPKGGDARTGARAFTAGGLILRWCERNGVDDTHAVVHRLLARLYTADSLDGAETDPHETSARPDVARTVSPLSDNGLYSRK
ncbi:hypothetical protein [Nocardiopsis sp. MG754419]|uniref:hypothetical protein n=1 Tax=Nocardiopsis sp. MG754419 TaxID=2259865 RepID=UPI001BA7D96A|nr:hypothetical protein [Nocardiopsis sp. MG754419]